MKDFNFGDFTWTTIKHNEAQRPIYYPIEYMGLMNTGGS